MIAAVISFCVGLLISFVYFFLLKKSLGSLDKKGKFIFAWVIRYALALTSLFLLHLFHLLALFWWFLGFGLIAIYLVKDEIRMQNESNI